MRRARTEPLRAQRHPTPGRPVAFSSRGGVLYSVRGGAEPVHRKPLRAAIWPGILGVSGTTCYFLATQAGTLSMSAVIASLYPAVTVALATIVLRERTTMWHGCGLALCAISVVAFVSG
ncbi:hypothetical protein E1292_43415 [Nonomuraea deserti]|uniref:EamA domain-containing protein n=1 Tax=Nonomuraea deserti TaxID=1848322 RepID=A0A4R4UQA0_9ACTN|nr:hypothetical protein E1292_43415 [Nonomuraea deserti]